MEKKQRRMVIVGVVLVILAVIIGVTVFVICRSGSVEEATEEVGLEDSAVSEAEDNAYGYVEAETVVALAAEFNARIAGQEGRELLSVSDETMVVHDNMYWYPLHEDVALVVVPVEFSGDKDKDVVLTMLIYTDKDSANRDRALEYFHCLVLANDGGLDADGVAGLISEAEDLRERGEMANRGDGIFVAINDADDHVEYQVVRNYRES